MRNAFERKVERALANTYARAPEERLLLLLVALLGIRTGLFLCLRLVGSAAVCHGILLGFEKGGPRPLNVGDRLYKDRL